MRGFSLAVLLGCLLGWTLSGADFDLTAASTATLLDNSATSFKIGSAGHTDALAFDTTNNAERVTINVPYRLSPALWDTFGEGASKGLRSLRYDGTGASTSTLVTNYLHAGTNTFLFTNIGGTSNTSPPVMSATGLNIAGEQTSGDGWELLHGILQSSGRPFVIGTDAAFTGCWTVVVGDVSGASKMMVGFRAATIANGTFTSYSEVAAIGISGSSNPATIFTITNAAGAGAVSTNTNDTVADGVSKTYCVLVSGAGAVTYTNDGIAPSNFVGATMSDGDVVVPFVWFTNGADLADTVDITLWDVRFQ